MPIQLPFVKFSNIMLKNEEAFETAKEAKNPNQNFDYSLLQSLFLISVLLILVYMVYSILLNIYFTFFLFSVWMPNVLAVVHGYRGTQFSLILVNNHVT